MGEASQQQRGTMAAEISDGLVHLHKRYYGKGPTKAKTYLVDDTVICMLRGGFTIVEKTLIDEGRADAVHEIRRSFQSAMEERFTAVVEQAIDRKVIAYMSQVHSDPDVALEVFLLEPGPETVAEEHELELEEGPYEEEGLGAAER